MRTIHSDTITEAVASLCMHTNRYLPDDVKAAMKEAYEKETSPIAQEIFRQLEENTLLAAETGLPLCLDTGLAVFFVELGQDLRIKGGPLREAINQGVRKGYGLGSLRKSMCDPFSRANTGDNTPATIHFDIVPGDRLRIGFMAKGGGSENMSRVTMLAPSEGWKGIKTYVVERVAEAGPNPCPPCIIGLGIGGSFDYAPILAKRALMRPVQDKNINPALAALEEELLHAINRLGIGPMGLGGRTTCLGVKIALEPCHIASLPLAVNIQ